MERRSEETSIVGLGVDPNTDVAVSPLTPPSICPSRPGPPAPPQYGGREAQRGGMLPLRKTGGDRASAPRRLRPPAVGGRPVRARRQGRLGPVQPLTRPSWPGCAHLILPTMPRICSELIKKGRFRWRDAQMKESTRSRNDKHQLYCGEQVLLC